MTPPDSNKRRPGLWAALAVTAVTAASAATIALPSTSAIADPVPPPPGTTTAAPAPAPAPAPADPNAPPVEPAPVATLLLKVQSVTTGWELESRSAPPE